MDEITNNQSIENPFKFGKVVRSNNFCNRKQEIAELKQHIANNYSVWLFSPRRFGKSSLVQKVFSETGSKTRKTIYIDLYNIRSLDDFCRKYSRTLANELFNWKDDIRNITKKAGKYFKSLYPKIAFDENGTPSFSLEKSEIKEQLEIEKILQAPELIASDRKLSICIAFDEFQEIERIEPFIINWMRSVFQQQENVSYIFLGSRQSLMESIFANLNSPFYEFAVKMDITPISYNDFYGFIEKKFLENGLDITSNTIHSILTKSGLHPHFTQYFASVVFDFIKNGHDQNSEQFTTLWMNYILESQSIIFQGIFDSLNTNQRAVMVAVAILKENEELFSDKIRTELKLPASSTVRTTLLALQKRSLINKHQGKYKITNPIMKEWLKLL